MTINKIQQAFEETVLKNDEDELGLEKFDDGTMWGSEDLTNCYEDTTTEMCFSFYQMGLDSKERDFFESKLKEAIRMYRLYLSSKSNVPKSRDLTTL